MAADCPRHLTLAFTRPKLFQSEFADKAAMLCIMQHDQWHGPSKEI
jgi:hypothetical protein